MSGPELEALLLVLNGLLAADLPGALLELQATVGGSGLRLKPVLVVIQRAFAGVSIGAVGVQNVQFGSCLEGGVLFAGVYTATVEWALEEKIQVLPVGIFVPL